MGRRAAVTQVLAGRDGVKWDAVLVRYLDDLHDLVGAVWCDSSGYLGLEV